MFPFIKMKKSLVTYSLIFLLILPIFGFKFLLSLFGNLLLLLILIPILIFLIAFIGFNFFTSSLKTCDKCGSVALGVNSNCMNCGADLENINAKNFENSNKPSETTIEIKAEEVK